MSASTAALAAGSPKTVTVTLNLGPPAGSGLVGAWGFDEATGTAVLDASGRGNAGTISGATRTTAGRYGAALTFGGDQGLDATVPLALNSWSHLAMTWDATTMRLYVNAAQVATRTQTGTLANSTGALRLGGNTIWDEWFAGRLDDIRIYDRALTTPELQTDMTTPVTGSP